MNWKVCGRKQSRRNLRYCYRTCMKKLRKITKKSVEQCQFYSRLRSLWLFNFDTLKNADFKTFCEDTWHVYKGVHLHSVFWKKNERRLMRPPCCLSLYPSLSVCPSISVWPSLCVSSQFFVGLWYRLAVCPLPKFSFSIRSVTYQRKEGD
jgi:hypothetical protein